MTLLFTVCRTPVLPHFDGFIYLVFIVVIGLAPLAHLLASCALEQRARYITDPYNAHQIVGYGCVSSLSTFLLHCLLTLLVLGEFVAMVLPNILFQGPLSTLLSPAVLWYSTIAVCLALSTMWRTYRFLVFGSRERGLAATAAKSE